MSTASIKTRIANDLHTDDLSDSNGTTRRYFSLWIGGDYLGQSHAKRNLQQINSTSSKALRSFVIQEFCDHISQDYGCSFGHAQKSIVAALSPAELETLTADLTQDCLDWSDSQSADAVEVVA